MNKWNSRSSKSSKYKNANPRERAPSDFTFLYFDDFELRLFHSFNFAILICCRTTICRKTPSSETTTKHRCVEGHNPTHDSQDKGVPHERIQPSSAYRPVVWLQLGSHNRLRSRNQNRSSIH